MKDQDSNLRRRMFKFGYEQAIEDMIEKVKKMHNSMGVNFELYYASSVIDELKELKEKK